MSKFNKGDYVTIADSYVDITQGRAYEVHGTHTSGRGGRVEIRDDAGDKHDVDECDCTLAPNNQAATGAATSNPFKVGDTVEYIGYKGKSNHLDMTVGRLYKVTEVSSTGMLRVRDDVLAVHDINAKYFKLTTVVPPARAASAPPTYQAQYDSTPADDDTVYEDDGLSYDQRKAAESVYSSGQWRKGQVLVYADGTPTLTTLTVKDCTATCVWFEETYSAPFNPTEFERG